MLSFNPEQRKVPNYQILTKYKGDLKRYGATYLAKTPFTCINGSPTALSSITELDGNTNFLS